MDSATTISRVITKKSASSSNNLNFGNVDKYTSIHGVMNRKTGICTNYV